MNIIILLTAFAITDCTITTTSKKQGIEMNTAY